MSFCTIWHNLILCDFIGTFIYKAQAGVKEKQREVQQRDGIIKVLKTDRQQAFETLKRHGIKVDNNIKVRQL